MDWGAFGVPVKAGVIAVIFITSGDNMLTTSFNAQPSKKVAFLKVESNKKTTVCAHTVDLIDPPPPFTSKNESAFSASERK